MTAAPTFEWDSEKAQANLKKHGVAFEEAATVFQEPLAKVHADPDDSLEEQRDILVGHSIQNRLLLVAFTDQGGKIRIIRAGQATPASVVAMKKRTSKANSVASDDLKADYDFDYAKARPSPYASRLKGRAVAWFSTPMSPPPFPPPRP